MQPSIILGIGITTLIFWQHSSWPPPISMYCVTTTTYIWNKLSYWRLHPSSIPPPYKLTYQLTIRLWLQKVLNVYKVN
jgi:hypothetical protein